MITKRNFIELVQDRLSGGEATMDVQGKYSYGAIEEVMTIVFSDIVSKDRVLAEQMAIPYPLTVTNNKVLLPAKPIMGTKGIVWIEGKTGLIPFSQGIGESSIMSYILPQLQRAAINVTGNYLFFKGITDANNLSEAITVSMIPTIKDLDEDDNVVVEANFATFYALVSEIMQPKPKDVVEDSVPDTDKPNS